MSQPIDPPIDVPALSLSRATEKEYCEYAQQTAQNECWWYLKGLAPYRRFSIPFRGPEGYWWYCVKPGFAWPLDFFQPLPARFPGPGKLGLLGWQYPVEPAAANSTVSMNVIRSLESYDWGALAEAKRRAVRKGLKSLDLVVLDPSKHSDCRSACEVWNSHVQRTGWNRPMKESEFAASWRELADWPGTTVLGARAKGTDTLCAFLIARVIDQTLFVDTLASHTDRLKERPNDALVFVCLRNGVLAGLHHAHYSLCSAIESLESFKQSMGFEPWAFPAYLYLRFPVRFLLKWLRPRDYRRLVGMKDGGTLGMTNVTGSPRPDHQTVSLDAGAEH